MWNKGGGTFMNFTAVVQTAANGPQRTLLQIIAISTQHSAISNQGPEQHK
jgi:hypothetical protein